MPLEASIKQRINALILDSTDLCVTSEGQLVRNTEQKGRCSAWLLAAHSVICKLCDSPEDLYRKRTAQILALEYGWEIHIAVQEVSAILEAVLADAEAGLLASVADRARAELFDDFLNHADAYVDADKKNEAGVIAGVVFEDSVRRICRKRSIPESDIELDQLISALTKRGDLTAAKAKRARAAAHVRTKATHAQWTEFEMDDVKAAIVFTRDLIESKLDG